MNKYLSRVIFRRTVKMLAGCIVPSVLICVLCISGPMPVGSLQRDITLLFAPIVFIVWNVMMLRRCYTALAGGKTYYLANICAYGIFALLDLCAYVFLPADSYTWIFVITKFLRYSSLGITSPIGILLFNIILIISIFLAPIGLGWIKEKRREKEEFISRMPGRLEVNPLEQKKDEEASVNESKTEKEKNSLS